MAMRDEMPDVPVGLPVGVPPPQNLTPPGLPPGRPIPPPRVPQGAETLPQDMIGDIPPPPNVAKVRMPNQPGVGIAGEAGETGGTFARPGTQAIRSFRSAAYSPAPMPSTGVAITGGSTAGYGDLGLSEEEAADLLQRLSSLNQPSAG